MCSELDDKECREEAKAGEARPNVKEMCYAVIRVFMFIVIKAKAMLSSANSLYRTPRAIFE